ncbi:putative WD repeat-containing protein [Diplonema papillatum]|nr:putative WD repeat-containing protein [Diplonema papillatum]
MDATDFLTSTLQELEGAALALLQKIPGYKEDDAEDEEATALLALRDSQAKRAGVGSAESLLSISAGSFNVSPIKVLKRLFSTKWSRSAQTVGVPNDVFVAHMAPILLPNTSEKALANLASRIDTDANGLIDWEEFSAHLLMNQQHGSEALESAENLYSLVQPQSQATSSKKVSAAVHKDIVHRVVCTPDKYFTASLDGTVKAWNPQTQQCLSTVLNDTNVAKSRYISDLLYLPVSNRLAVLQIDRTLSLFDVTTHAMQRVYRGVESKKGLHGSERFREVQEPDMKGDGRVRHSLVASSKKIEVMPMCGLGYSPMCAEVVMPSMQKRLFPSIAEPVLLGLEQGYVQLYNLRRDTGREPDFALRLQQWWRPHSSWVTRIKVCDRLDALITLSLDQILKVYNLEKGEEIHSLRGQGMSSSFAKDAAILGFDYNEEINLIATWGGSTALLWNPTMSNPTKLQQKSPVVSVRFNAEERHTFVLTEDKTVSVYDTRSSKCVQQIVDKVVRRPENRLCAMEWDQKRGNIVCTASTPVLFCSNKKQERSADAITTAANRLDGHEHPVLAALHNEFYNHIVSADASKVFVWDASSGARISTWGPGDRITSLTFDTGKRRLLCAAPAGYVGIWNYMTGEELKRCVSPADPFEISCLQHVDIQSSSPEGTSLVVAAGWSTRILLWSDTAGEFSVPLRQELNIGNSWGHIYSVAFHVPNKLAFGTSSGSVIVYDLSQMTVFTVLKSKYNTPAAALPTVSQRCSALSENDSPMAAPAQGGESSSDPAHALAEFQNFRSKMQQGLSTIVEQVSIVSSSVLLSLHGNSVVIVWKLGKRDTSEIVSAFISASSAREDAFVMESAAGKGLVIVGDSAGVVSIFDASSAFTAKPLNPRHRTQQDRGHALAFQNAVHALMAKASGDNASCAAYSDQGRSGHFSKKKSGHQPVDSSSSPKHLEAALRAGALTHKIRVVACFKAHTSVISSIAWLADTELVLTASADSEIYLHNAQGIFISQLGASAFWPIDQRLAKLQAESPPGEGDVSSPLSPTAKDSNLKSNKSSGYSLRQSRSSHSLLRISRTSCGVEAEVTKEEHQWTKRITTYTAHQRLEQGVQRQIALSASTSPHKRHPLSATSSKSKTDMCSYAPSLPNVKSPLSASPTAISYESQDDPAKLTAKEGTHLEATAWFQRVARLSRQDQMSGYEQSGEAESPSGVCKGDSPLDFAGQNSEESPTQTPLDSRPKNTMPIPQDTYVAHPPTVAKPRVMMFVPRLPVSQLSLPHGTNSYPPPSKSALTSRRSSNSVDRTHDPGVDFIPQPPCTSPPHLINDFHNDSVRRPHTARAKGTDIHDAFKELQNKLRPEVAGVLVSAQHKAAASDEAEEGKSEGEPDLELCRKAHTVSWAHTDNFLPHGLSVQRPPTFLGTQIQPSPRLLGARSRRHASNDADTTVEDAAAGDEHMPSKFFNQFKAVVEQKENKTLAKLMLASQTMQATRNAKQQESKTVSSYSMLQTARVAPVATTKPYPDPNRNRRSRQAGKDLPADVYTRL